MEVISILYQYLMISLSLITHQLFCLKIHGTQNHFIQTCTKVCPGDIPQRNDHLTCKNKKCSWFIQRNKIKHLTGWTEPHRPDRVPETGQNLIDPTEFCRVVARAALALESFLIRYGLPKLRLVTACCAVCCHP